MTGVSPCPILSVQPMRALIDEKLQIVVKNVGPREKITLHSFHCSEDEDLWEAFGHYVSDETGRISVAEDTCLGGTYQGLEPMGLLWSMRPLPGNRKGIRLRKKDVCTPMSVQISVYRGHVNQGFSKQAALAGVLTERWYMAPGLRKVDINQDGIRGTLFLPPGPGPYPAIVDLLGGGGGLFEYHSALLASHGYAALALQYLSDFSTTAARGLKYFEKAFTIMRNHPQVAGDRVALCGFSFGSSISLSLAVYSDIIKPRCIVCISGSHLYPFTYLKDVVDKMNRNIHKARFDENHHLIWKDMILPIMESDAKVEVGRLKCPLMMVIGEDDQNSASAEAVQDIRSMMERAGNAHLLTTLSYPGAGHLIESPYTPHSRSSNFHRLFSKDRGKVIMLWGGQPEPHAFAQENSWRRILLFLQKHLHQKQDQPSKL